MASLPSESSEGSFSAPSTIHTFSGFLFDLDGTIIDSTEAITKHWQRYALLLLHMQAYEQSPSSRHVVGEVKVPSIPLSQPPAERFELNVSERLGRELGFDAETLLRTSHGRRSIDTLRILAPDKATWECKTSRMFLRFMSSTYSGFYRRFVSRRLDTH